MRLERGAGATPTWEPAWDHKSKRWYFSDRVNGTSCWTQPPGCSLSLPTEPPAFEAQGAPPAEGLPVGWRSAFDVARGRWFFYNSTTQERSWKSPVGAVGGGAVGGGAGGGGAGGGAGRGAAAGAVGARALREPILLPGAPAPPGGFLQAPQTDYGGRSSSAPTKATSPLSREAEEARAAATSPAPAPGGRNHFGVGAGAKRGVGPGTPSAGSWDPAAFRLRLQQAQDTGDRNAVKAVLREVAEHNYSQRHSFGPVPRTQAVPESLLVVPDRLPPQQGKVSFSGMTTGDAVKHFDRARRQSCALNFANGTNVGGGYKNGAQAQEEDLCRRFPCLYTSLNNAVRDGLYPFGPTTFQSDARPMKYSEVLWTPNLVLARSGEDNGFAMLPPAEHAKVSMVAAAAANVRFAKPPEVYDLELMYKTIKAMFLAPKVMARSSGVPEVDTLILGAWGCGAFGGNPNEIADLFCRALIDDQLNRLYKEVHFAIPQFGDDNAALFREVFRNKKVNFEDLTIDSHVV